MLQAMTKKLNDEALDVFQEAMNKKYGKVTLFSLKEMITRLTMSQRSFPICYKNPFLVSTVLEQR